MCPPNSYFQLTVETKKPENAVEASAEPAAKKLCGAYLVIQFVSIPTQIKLIINQNRSTFYFACEC